MIRQCILRAVCAMFASTATAAMAQVSYLCVSDLATGFKYDESRKQWNTARFKAGDKYVVAKSKKQGVVWEVKELGKEFPIASCDRDFDGAGWLVCGEAFRVSRNSMRFLRFFSRGYWYMNDPKSDGYSREDGGDTPYIEIGTCTTL